MAECVLGEREEAIPIREGGKQVAPLLDDLATYGIAPDPSQQSVEASPGKRADHIEDRLGVVGILEQALQGTPGDQGSSPL